MNFLRLLEIIVGSGSNIYRDLPIVIALMTLDFTR